MNGILQQIERGFIGYLPKLAAAIVIFILGWWFVKIVLRVFDKSIGKRIKDESLRRYFFSALSILLRVLLLFIAASTAGVETASFLTILGAAGLAIGLALQGSLANIAGGVLILVFKPFKVGEYIETINASGIVIDIQMFHTVLRTGDNKIIVLPNGPLAGGNISNHTREPIRRVDCSVVIPHSENAEHIMRLIKHDLVNDNRIKTDKAPDCYISKITDTAVTIEVKAWTDTNNTDAVSASIYQSAYSAIHSRLDDN